MSLVDRAQSVLVHDDVEVVDELLEDWQPQRRDETGALEGVVEVFDKQHEADVFAEVGPQGGRVDEGGAEAGGFCLGRADRRRRRVLVVSRPAERNTGVSDV